MKRKNSVAQKNTSRLIDKLVSYMLHVRRFTAKHNYSPANIIAMDEKPVWLDMVSNTTVDKTGARTVTMKSTGYVIVISHAKLQINVRMFVSGWKW